MAIFATRRLGNYEVRSEFGSSAIPAYSGSFSSSGEVVTLERAVGLPAVIAAIRLVSETIGGMSVIVYRGSGEERVRAPESSQWRLLHDAPNDEQSAFDFFCDVSASIEATGNAYIQKAKSRRQVEALVLLDPGRVQVKRDRDSGQKIFQIQTSEGRKDKTEVEIVHIRGFAFAGSDVGFSPIALCRNALGTALAQDNFQSKHFSNGARPGAVLQVPGNVTKEQADKWRDDWDSIHGGAWQAGRTAVIGGGIEFKPVPVSLEDSQFIESQRFSVQQVARIFRVPASLLGEVLGVQGVTTSEESERFLKFSLQPRLRRIELSLKADPDLFGASDLYPEFLADSILRSDTRSRYEAYRAARQAGWLSPNEIRALENYPPVDGGDEIQLTPVGGAPNEATPPPPTDEETDGKS